MISLTVRSRGYIAPNHDIPVFILLFRQTRRTALHVASSTRMTEILLKYGANIRAKDIVSAK